MGDTERFEQKPVRVLRHQFLMSEKFEKAIKSLLETDRIASEPLHTFSSGQVVADLSLYREPDDGGDVSGITPPAMQKLEAALLPAMKAFRKETAPIAIARSDEEHAVRIARVENNRVRIQLFPLHQAYFNALVGGLKDIKQVESQDASRHQANKNRYLYVDVAAISILHDKQKRAKALEIFAKEQHLYSVIPLDITGYDRFMQVSSKPTYREDLPAAV